MCDVRTVRLSQVGVPGQLQCHRPEVAAVARRGWPRAGALAAFLFILTIMHFRCRPTWLVCFIFSSSRTPRWLCHRNPSSSPVVPVVAKRLPRQLRLVRPPAAMRPQDELEQLQLSLASACTGVAGLSGGCWPPPHWPPRSWRNPEQSWERIATLLTKTSPGEEMNAKVKAACGVEPDWEQIRLFGVEVVEQLVQRQ